MGSPIKINSISIDLADAANKTDMVKCEHFSIRRFVAEACERDPKICWPFSEKSLSLADQESFSFPLSSPEFRWWGCTSCVKDLKTDETKTSDCGLHSNTKTIGEKNLDGNSLVIPSKSTLNLLTVIDHEKEQKTHVAGNAVEENENAIRERSQKENHQTATMLLKKALPRAKDASTVRSKSRKLASPEQVGNKRSKEKQKVDQDVTAFGPSDIAGVVEGKATKNRKGTRVQMECDNVSSESGLLRRKNPKLRLLSDLLAKANTKTSGGSNNNVRKEESSGSKRESVRGRKRKVLPENNNVNKKLRTTSENASKSSDSDSESTDSEGLDRDPIKGKQKNRRFQVVDEFVPSSSLPCETSQEGIHVNGVAPSKSTALTIPVQDSVPCPRPSTHKTEKKLSLAKKKTKKPVIDNVKKGLISFSTGMDEGNQVKPRNGPSVSQLSTRDLLNEKRVGDDRLAAERCFIGYTPQSNGKLVICSPLQDNGHVRPRDAETNCFGSSSKSNTVGWLRSGVDVADPRSNNNNTYTSSFTNFKQHTPTSAEVVNLSSVLQKGASGADRKGKTVMVPEHHGASGSQSHDKKANIPEEHNDDIPMEIVELMAKNQYERCLPDKEEEVSNKQPSQETAHKSKNGLLIDLNETYDNGISHEDNNTSRLPIPYGNDARNNGHFPMGKQQKPLDFFPISKPCAPPRFGIFPSTQENRAAPIQFSGQNSQWLGNVPTMATQNPSPSPSRVLRGCKTCQSVPHQYREAAHPPIWSSAVTQPPQGYHKQVSFNMDKSTRPGMPSQAPSSNGNNWNLNFVGANGKQKSVPNSEFSFACKHAAAGTSHNNTPADAFTSESSIPAMHLLSLMNPQLRSNTPVDHHVNAKFTERRFPPVNQSKGFTEFQTRDSSKQPFPTKQLPFDFSQRFAPEAPCMGFPIGQPLGTSSFSFQNAQASWSQHQHQEKQNKRKEMGPPPVYNSREKAPVFASGSDQGKFQLLGASNSMMLPLKFHVTDKEKKQKRKADSSSNAAALAMKNVTTGPIECCVNRNPADFTIPEPGNVYMITGESLKIRKRAASKRKPSLCKQDTLKQNKKPVAGPATENT
ncbi:unnamed protein product [Arabis nemorensis]|uniref:Embryonic flower 1 n=1 Tax=Arabis nemorensis TaxID=586526 RepID=A0A565CK75_9BRAS|nr:unnamed protein product [Arabis nemorensis]